MVENFVRLSIVRDLPFEAGRRTACSSPREINRPRLSSRARADGEGSRLGPSVTARFFPSQASCVRSLGALRQPRMTGRIFR